jgi:hypothetical protein
MIEDLKNELVTLNTQISNNRIISSIQIHIVTILKILLRIGLSENDIADINSILFLGGLHYNNNNRENAVINQGSLIFELHKYKNIKLAI